MFRNFTFLSFLFPLFKDEKEVFCIAKWKVGKKLGFFFIPEQEIEW